MIITSLITNWYELKPKTYIIILTLFGLVLRLPYLFERDLWFDEIFQHYIITGGPLSEFSTRLINGDRYPPGFSILGMLITSLTSDQHYLRLLSLTVGVLCIPLALIAGNLSFGKGCGSLAAVLVAVNPVYIFYSREARPVELGLFTIFLLIVGIGYVLQSVNLKSTILCILAAASVAFSHYSGTVVGSIMLACSIAWAFSNNYKLTRNIYRLFSGLLVIACVGIWTYLEYAKAQIQIQGTGGAFLNENFFNIRNPEEVLHFAIDRTGDLLCLLVTGGLPGPRWRLLASITIIVPLVTGLILRRRQQLAGWVNWSAGIAIIVFIAMAGLGLHPYGGIRHVLVLTPALIIGFSASIDSLRGHQLLAAKIAADLFFSLVIVFAGYGLIFESPTKYRKDISLLLEDIKPEIKPNSTIFVAGGIVSISVVNELTHDSAAAVLIWRSARFAKTDWSVVSVKFSESDVIILVNDSEELNSSIGAAIATSKHNETVWIIDTPSRHGSRDISSTIVRYRKTLEIVRRGCVATRWELVPLGN